MVTSPEGVYICGPLTGLGSHDVNGIALVFQDAGSWTVRSFGDGLTDSWGHPVWYQGRLTVAGMRTDANGDNVYGAYTFAGSQWTRLDTGTFRPTDLAVYDGNLYLTGSLSPFEVSSSVCQLPGDDRIFVLETDSIPRTMIVHDGRLVVAGEFTTVDGVAATNICTWDGFTVQPLGDGFPHPVTSLITVGDELVVAGNAGRNDGLIASWDGVAWTVLLDAGRRVDSLTDWNGQLVAATDSLYDTSLGTVHNPDIMVLDAGQWTSLTKFRTTDIAAVGDALLIQNPDYYGMAGNMIAPGLVVYRTGSFEAPFPAGLGFGLAAWDTRLSLTQRNGLLIAGGRFRYGGAQAMSGAGVHDGFSWAGLDSFDLGLAAYQEPEGFEDIVALGDVLFGTYRIREIDVTLPALVKWDPDPPANGVWKRVFTWSWGPSRLQAAQSQLFNWSSSRVWALDPGSGFPTDITPLLDGDILAAGAVDSHLVVAGDFQTLGGAPSSNLLRYGDSGWSDFAPALPGPAVAIRELPDSDLAAAYRVGDIHRVAVFDGLAWSDRAGDFDGPVQVLAWHQDRLVAAGYFSQVAGLAAAGIAVWTGTGWAKLGSGLGDLKLNGRIVDMESTASGLFVSGGMRTAGGHRTSGLALWTGDLSPTANPAPGAADVPQPADLFGLQAHPNPFNPRTAIAFTIPARGSVQLSIFDLRGHRVRSLLSGTREAGPIEVFWDGKLDSGQPAPSGLYRLLLEWNGRTASRKLTLVR